MNKTKQTTILRGSDKESTPLSKCLSNQTDTNQLYYQKIKDNLLNKNPKFLNKFVMLNSIKEDIQLFEFMIKEQQIMYDEIIKTKLSQLIENIDKLKCDKTTVQGRIEQLKKQKIHKNQQIKNIQLKITKKYEQKRKQLNNKQTITNHINEMATNTAKTSKCKQNSQSKYEHIIKLIQIQQLAIKKNQNTKKENNSEIINKQTIENQKYDQNTNAAKEKEIDQQILKSIQRKASNQVMQRKIDHLKSQVRTKIMVLKQKIQHKKMLRQEIQKITT